MPLTTPLLKDLKALLALFSDPSKWAQRSLAKDAEGNPCSFSSEKAVCFCLLGGCHKVVGDDSKRVEALKSGLRRGFPANSKWTYVLGLFNDESTYEEVLTLIVRAIKVEESK